MVPRVDQPKLATARVKQVRPKPAANAAASANPSVASASLAAGVRASPSSAADARRFTADGELYLDVANVTDSNGATPEPGRARYETGESYNVGAVGYISAARVRAGALELLKELD